MKKSQLKRRFNHLRKMLGSELYHKLKRNQKVFMAETAGRLHIPGTSKRNPVNIERMFSAIEEDS